MSNMADMFCVTKKIRFGFLEVLKYSLAFIMLLSLVGITCSIRCQPLSSAVGGPLCSPPITAAVYTGSVSVGEGRSIFGTGRKSRRCLNGQRLFRPVLWTFVLLVGIHPHLGPRNHTAKSTVRPRLINNVVIGSLNARSAVLHTADLQMTIHDEALNIIVVCEKRIPIDMPDVVGKDLTRPGFNVINQPSPPHRHGYGLAVIYEDIFNIKPVKLSHTPTTFEAMVVNIVIGTERFVFASIYRFHGTSILDFLDELFELDECLCMVGRHPIIVGDSNCPGTSDDVVDYRLDNWLTCYNFVAINDGSTRMHHDCRLNKLDLIIEQVQSRRFQDSVTMLIGYSDHRLIKVVLRIARPRVLQVTYTYRDYRRMDMPAFRSSVCTSKSMLSPSADLDDAVRQLDADLTAALGHHAPLRKRTKRSSKHNHHWLSSEAIAAKQMMRRMERRFASLLHFSSSLLHSTSAWYEGRDTTILANGISDFFRSQTTLGDDLD